MMNLENWVPLKTNRQTEFSQDNYEHPKLYDNLKPISSPTIE
jgi:hypothetical protein